MVDNKQITARFDEEIFDWLKLEAKKKDCSINEILNQAVLLFKKINDDSEKNRFSDSLHIQGSKAAIMTYRLLVGLIVAKEKEAEEIIMKSRDFGLKEIAQHKIKIPEKEEI